MLEVDHGLLVHLEVEVGKASLQSGLNYLKVLRRLISSQESLLGKELECLRVG